MENIELRRSNPHQVDLRTIDNGKLIYPAKAEGLDVDTLDLKGIKIPVSFAVLPEGYFRMNGIEKEETGGVVMSGFLSSKDAKINHVLVDENLRQYAKEQNGQRVGEVALRYLEGKLKEHGADSIYAVFYSFETVEFFRRNGYTIIPINSLEEEKRSRLGIDANGFDPRVQDDKSFDELKAANPDRNQHVLLEKRIG